MKTEQRTWQQEIADWENTYLVNGRYNGPDLKQFGFLFKPGEFVPVTCRYSTMLAHGHCLKAHDMSMSVYGLADSRILSSPKYRRMAHEHAKQLISKGI